MIRADEWDFGAGVNWRTQVTTDARIPVARSCACAHSGLRASRRVYAHAVRRRVAEEGVRAQVN